MYYQSLYIIVSDILLFHMIKEHEYQFKMVIVGNQGVGKSSIFVRFCDSNFEETYLPTIGVDFRFKLLDVDNKNCKIQIWDTAGQQRFRTITSAYYRNSQVILIVYDRTDPQSFKEIEQYWLQQARNNVDCQSLICIVGNKFDIPSQILDTQVSLFVQTEQLDSFSISAKTGEGVQAMFKEICEKLITTKKVRMVEKNIRIEQDEEEQDVVDRPKKRCCK